MTVFGWLVLFGAVAGFLALILWCWAFYRDIDNKTKWGGDL